MPVSATGQVTTWVGGALWLGGLGFGLLSLMHAETVAGPIGDVPETWPDTPEVVRADDRLTVVVALHPHCPCSAATLETLTGLMQHAPIPSPRVYLLFHADRTRPADWVESPLWHRAGTLPFTRVRDIDGGLGKRFGALTSGFVVVYGPDGRRGHAGGLTPSRGTVAGNDHLASLADVLFEPHPADDPRAPVFGCPLESPVTR